jgi:carboxyl-terminal processing protease
MILERTRHNFRGRGRAADWAPPPITATGSPVTTNCPKSTDIRYFTPSGRSIQAKGISPDIEVLQEVPEELKARTDTRGEASLRGHLKAGGDEQTGSQSYIPPDPKDDKALHTALDLIRGIQKDSAYPPNPKTAVPN